MIMQVEHHELHREFPDFVDTIQTLRTSDSFFCQMYDQYHILTSKVERLEEDDIPVDDFTFENLKKQRVMLKDKMYKMLVAHRQENPN